MQEYLFVIGSRESFKFGFSSTKSALVRPDWSINEGKMGPSPIGRKKLNLVKVFFSSNLSM